MVQKLAGQEVRVYGEEGVKAVTHVVRGGETIKLGAQTIRVHHVPCHTRGHVLYHVEPDKGDPMCFTGDTQFLGGCGKFFAQEGEPGAEMDRALNGVIARMAPQTLLYCGHEYSVSNLRFAAVSNGGKGGKARGRHCPHTCPRGPLHSLLTPSLSALLHIRQSVEPENDAVKEKAQWCAQQREEGKVRKKHWLVR